MDHRSGFPCGPIRKLNQSDNQASQRLAPVPRTDMKSELIYIKVLLPRTSRWSKTRNFKINSARTTRLMWKRARRFMRSSEAAHAPALGTRTRSCIRAKLTDTRGTDFAPVEVTSQQQPRRTKKLRTKRATWRTDRRFSSYPIGQRLLLLFRTGSRSPPRSPQLRPSRPVPSNNCRHNAVP